MEKIYIGTNTKMYMTAAQTRAFLLELQELTRGLDRNRLELFVIPPFTTLQEADACADRSLIRLGAQNIAWAESGQFTGEISPEMLKEFGIEIAEIGHSERRHVLMETNEMENKKVGCALRNGLTALLCIGETAEEKGYGVTGETLGIQIKTALHGVTAEQTEKLWIAYEPVWAIGATGTPATSDYAARQHKTMRGTLCELYGDAVAHRIPLLYGGNVNPQNAVEMISQQDIDGLFIGRNAWEAKKFSGIIEDALSAVFGGR